VAVDDHGVWVRVGSRDLGKSKHVCVCGWESELGISKEKVNNEKNRLSQGEKCSQIRANVRMRETEFHRIGAPGVTDYVKSITQISQWNSGELRKLPEFEVSFRLT
jgi:hypothetical protein